MTNLIGPGRRTWQAAGAISIRKQTPSLQQEQSLPAMALQAASFSPTISIHKEVYAAGTVVLKNTGLSGLPFSEHFEVKSKSLRLRNKVNMPIFQFSG